MSLMQPGSKFIIRLVSEEYTNNRIDYPKKTWRFVLSLGAKQMGKQSGI